jgi:hypothetical protein
VTEGTTGTGTTRHRDAGAPACVAAGEVVLYNWVEWLKEQELLWAVPTAGASQPRGRGQGAEQQLLEATEEEGGARGAPGQRHTSSAKVRRVGVA